MFSKRNAVGGLIASATSLFAGPKIASASAAASPQGHKTMPASPEQLQSALTYCIGFAEQMLQDSGEFYPFGAVVSAAGIVEARGGWTGSEHPEAVELYALLGNAFRNDAEVGKILAAALAVNVNIPAEYQPVLPDGIRVHLESRDFSRYIYIPYKLAGSGKKRTVEFAELFAVGVGHQFFVKPTG